jgi:hypothetical protein
VPAIRGLLVACVIRVGRCILVSRPARCSPFRLRCDAIRYRQGFVETKNIHPGLVNIEAWEVDTAISPLPVWVSDESLPDTAIVGNIELELTPLQARLLAESLLNAASIAETQSQDSL